jgi:hypothetical protein
VTAAVFPERQWYRWAETGDAATKALLRWVNGGAFHPYGMARHEEEGWQAGEYRDWTPILEFSASLCDGLLRWSVKYRRVGDPDSWGMSSGYPTSEDAAYGACSMIEADEREQYELNLVAGLA